MIKAFCVYLIFINIVAYALYFDDKQRAIKHKWRISEAMLIGIAAIGGSVGALLGMKTFRHKTKHIKFKFGIPIILLIQIIILVLWF